MKCLTCEKNLRKNWNFCPYCGNSKNNDAEVLGDTSDYISFRDNNLGPVRKNFLSLKNIGFLSPPDNETIRESLGDYASINLLQLQILSIISYKPKLLEDILRIARLMGYYMVFPSTENLGVKQYVWFLKKKSRNKMAIPANKTIVKFLDKSWKKIRIGKIKKISYSKNKIVGEFSEIGCSIKAVDKKYCTLSATYCGIAETLTQQIWTGNIKKCNHIDGGNCIIEIKPGDKKFVDTELTNNIEKDLEELVENFMYNKSPYEREEMGNNFHMSLHQVLNFIIIKTSPGHKVIYRYTASRLGKIIAEKKTFNEIKDGLEFLKTAFFNSKICNLDFRIKDDRIWITLNESIFSSGVKRISENLDVFIEGMLEGLINSITENRYTIKEVRCKASGNYACELIAIKRR